MNKKIIVGLFVLLSLFVATTYGQTGYYTDTRDASSHLPNAVGGEVKSPNSEHYLALQHLKHATLREDREFVAFLSFYTSPEELLDTSIRLGNATIMSISAGNKHELLKPVRGSNSLFWIDIRDYNWNRKVWELVAAQDPYFQEPWINDEDVDEFINVGNKTNKDGVLAVNFIVNGNWFIANHLDATRQDDVDKEELYYQLLYSNLGGPPKTVAGFRAIWGVNENRVDTFGQARGIIVPKGKSAVARNERQIVGVGTDLGYYYETSDFRSGIFSIIDNLDPSLELDGRDASESIASNGEDWQVYWLSAFINGNEQRVEFADPTVAIDTSTNVDDVRVRMIVSCIICHSHGLNTGYDKLQNLIEKDISLNIDDRDLYHALSSFYLNDFNGRLLQHRQQYEYAVKRDTGWTPDQFIENLQKFYAWYSQPLDVYQAARETGVDVYAFITKTKATTSAEIAGLHREGHIPRDLWEIGDNSRFVESMLLIYRTQIVANTRATQKGADNSTEAETVITTEKVVREPAVEQKVIQIAPEPQPKVVVPQVETNTEAYLKQLRLLQETQEKLRAAQTRNSRQKDYFDLYWQPTNRHYTVYQATLNQAISVSPQYFPKTILPQGTTVYVYEGDRLAIFYGNPNSFHWTHIDNLNILTPVWK